MMPYHNKVTQKYTLFSLIYIGLILLPPTLAVVKNSLIVVTTTLLDKGNLVAYAELNKLTYMHVGLG